MINKTDDERALERYAGLFDALWREPGRLVDVTEDLCRQLEQIYAENAPARIYHLMLSVIFKAFLEDLNEDLLPNELGSRKQRSETRSTNSSRMQSSASSTSRRLSTAASWQTALGLGRPSSR